MVQCAFDDEAQLQVGLIMKSRLAGSSASGNQMFY